MTKPKQKPVPGEVTARQHEDGTWSWRWRSPKGTEHLGPGRHTSKRAAVTAGNRFARKYNTPAEDSE